MKGNSLFFDLKFAICHQAKRSAGFTIEEIFTSRKLAAYAP
jgi:hypothetical protein